MVVTAAVNAVCGSSSLTQGKQPCDRAHAQRTGFIPAHAGKTAVAKVEGQSKPGSSPLTRGKPRGEGAPCVPEGLIPAHAGKTNVLG